MLLLLLLHDNGFYTLERCLIFHLPAVRSENAEIIGQHLTLPRWIQILSARLRGLKSLSQGAGKSRNCQSTAHAAQAVTN